jgi:hypothetical protein
MAEHDLAIVNGEVVLPGGRVQRLNVGAAGGRSTPRRRSTPLA